MSRGDRQAAEASGEQMLGAVVWVGAPELRVGWVPYARLHLGLIL